VADLRLFFRNACFACPVLPLNFDLPCRGHFRSDAYSLVDEEFSMPIAILTWRLKTGFIARSILALLALGLLAAIPNRVLAGNMDDAMLKAATEVLEYCQQKGWKNVGVLKFRVVEHHKGNKAHSTWNEGRLNTYLARRLENSLVVVGNGSVGVTRNAGAQAVLANKRVCYLQPAGRQQLFSRSYYMVAGAAPLKVDAFLTGTASISADFKDITVSIKAWDKTLDFQKIMHFNVRTDRSALVEMNRSFVIKRSAGKSTKSRNNADNAAVNNVANNAKNKNKNNSGNKFLSQYLDFQLLYDNQPVAIQTGNDNSKFMVGSPQAGQKVFMQMTSKERVAVVLLVNGMNTYLKEGPGKEPAQYAMWVLDQPGQKYGIAGFYPDAQKVEPFQALADDQSMTYPLADETKRGLIEIFIFKEGTTPESNNTPATNTKRFQFRAKSYRQAVHLLKSKMTYSRSSHGLLKRGLIVQDSSSQEAQVQQTAFANPRQVAALVIQYYQKQQ
jgi:hypothetical protein